MKNFSVDVHRDGEAVGFYSDSTGNSHGFREFHGAFTSFDVPGALGTAPRAVNSSGGIAGEYSDATTSHGFLLVHGTLTKVDFPGATSTVLGGINNAGVSVGSFVDVAGNEHAFFRATDGSFTTFDYPGAIATEAHGINARGDAVGFFVDVTGRPHGFLLSKGVFTQIEPPGARTVPPYSSRTNFMVPLLSEKSVPPAMIAAPAAV